MFNLMMVCFAARVTVTVTSNVDIIYQNKNLVGSWKLFIMVNCAIPGCFVSKTPKYVGKSLFKITQRQNEFYSEWRKKVVDIVSKYRDMTPTFKKEVLDCTRELHICEDHYKTEDINYINIDK